MADNEESGKPDSKEVAPPASAIQPKIFKVFGREFDISSDQGTKDASLWAEAHESARGRMAQEIGTLRKEVEPLRKYNLKQATLDEMDLRKKVSSLREEGNHLEADNLLFEYGKQTRLASEAALEKERLWEDYCRSRPEIFESIDRDLAKAYVFSNYGKTIEDEEDPAALIDRVLKPKASKVKPQEKPVVPAVLGSGSAPDQISKPKEKEEEKGPSAMQKVLEEFGFR